MAEQALTAAWQQPDRIIQEMSKSPTICAGEQWLVGLDLGQTSDPSALALLRQTKVTRDKDRRRYYDCLALKRWPLKTAYDAIVDDVCKMFAIPAYTGQLLVVDMTGVGRPVVDLFRRQRIKAKLTPVTITGGAGSSFDPDSGGWHVSKRELVSVLHTLLGGTRFGSEQRLFQIAAALPLAPELRKEFENFKAKINLTTANVSLEAWRESDHDDIVLACAMPCWIGERTQQRFTMA